jgi:hypothetical protein
MAHWTDAEIEPRPDFGKSNQRSMARTRREFCPGDKRLDQGAHPRQAHRPTPACTRCEEADRLEQEQRNADQ